MRKQKRLPGFNDLCAKRYIFFLAAAAISSYSMGQGMGPVSADTIYKKDGGELKGVVLEEYEDRVTISTASGELAVMKSEIDRLYYDDEEKAFLKLAEKAREKGDYLASFDYYEKALALNPNSRDAKEGLSFLQEYIYGKDQSLAEDFIKGHNSSDDNIERALAAKIDAEGPARDAVVVKRRLGITLMAKDNTIEVASVARNSPAHEAGLRQRDAFVAIWGKLVRYMSLDRVLSMLAKNYLVRTECTIERTVEIRKNRAYLIADTSSLIGATFGIKLEGLTVLEVRPDGPASEAGLNQDDLVVAIDGSQTRYMPLRKALQLIRGDQDKSVRLTVQRKLMLVRKGEEQ